MIDSKLSALCAIAHNIVVYRYDKKFENIQQQRNYIHQNLIITSFSKMQLNKKAQAISSMSFCISAATKFVSITDRKTDILYKL